ncbi:MAG: pyridoxamine 5'-phosphate oxidase family protein [Pseudomonadota bacterium]
MADFYDQLNDELTAFIGAQSMFFVATAAPSGRINLSPKGLDTFCVLDPKTCAYLDLTGSGNETAAHIKHDGRMTIMFNSFDKKPLILRLYGNGRVAGKETADFKANIDRFPETPGVRQIIFIDVETVQTSCGYAVPEMTLVKPRPVLERWATAKGPTGIVDYQRENNLTSIDGLDTGLSPQLSDD